MEDPARTIREDTYDFLGHRVIVRSNSPEVRDHLGSVYAYFLRRRDSSSAAAHGSDQSPHVITVIDDIATSRQLLLSDKFHSYHLWCKDVWNFDWDRYRASTVPDPLTYVQWMVLTSVSLLAQDYHLFHAGSVSWNGKGMIFPAASGRGKTTLTLKLATRGFKFLSDEVACIRPDCQTVEPFFRKLNLSEESRRLIGLPEWSESAPRTRRTREWVLDVADVTPGSYGEISPLDWIVFLEAFGDEPRVKGLAPSDALLKLFTFSLSPVNNPAAMLYEFAPLFTKVRCVSLTVGNLEDTTNLLRDLAEEKISASL